MSSTSSRVVPFKVDLSDAAIRMVNLVENTRLPDTSVYSGLGADAGIDPEMLRRLQSEWIHNFDWKAEEEDINR